MTDTRASAAADPHRSPRAAAVAALPFLAGALVVAGVYASLRHRLPDPMATHFGSGGEPDGFTSLAATIWVPVIGMLLTGAVFAAINFFSGAPLRARRGITAIGYAVAGLLGYLFVAIFYVSADVPDAADVRFPAWQIAVALGLAAAVAAIGWLVAGLLPAPAGPGPRDAAPQAERLGLAAGERAAWTRSIGSMPAAVIGVAAFCAGLVLVFTVGTGPAIAPLLLGLTAAMLGSLRVTVDRRGLSLAPRVLPLPRVRIPLSRIEEARVRDIRVFKNFGWGYRVHPGVSGIVLRSGEAISLRLATGSEFLVSIDDARTAAGLLNSLIDRRPAAGRRAGGR
ncbi:DUF1648 domain-containing protein [Streptomyces varsoviensis]|nr:DUF1648 domain-containing protein [Streptomyces varsoviensis]